eukprot:1734634-Pyramimonas_sp.AAC.1
MHPYRYWHRRTQATLAHFIQLHGRAFGLPPLPDSLSLRRHFGHARGGGGVCAGAWCDDVPADLVHVARGDQIETVEAAGLQRLGPFGVLTHAIDVDQHLHPPLHLHTLQPLADGCHEGRASEVLYQEGDERAHGVAAGPWPCLLGCAPPG